MAIHFEFHPEGNLLGVRAWGFDESLAQVQDYGLAILQACLRHGYTHVLCDETKLEYRLTSLDTYQAAATIAEQATRLVKVAIVCDPRFIQDARFFEDVAVNRGLSVRAFRDLAAARTWVGAGNTARPAPDDLAAQGAE